jgi:tetratricopeptide (TPR) repeat protein
MKRLRFFLTTLVLVLFSSQLFAGPLTNKEEIEADALLTKQQQEEYQQRLDRGLNYFDQGDYANAEKEFQTILTFAPKKALAYFNLGLTKYKMKDYKAAIENFDKVIKMKSYYVGAALYYRAISQMNLGDTEGAEKTAKRYTESRFYYDESQQLLKTIKSGSDEYFKNAQDAYIEGNFELCLLELEMSALTDTPKGVDLTTKCKNALATQEKEEPTVIVEAKKYVTEFYMDARLSQSDNVYQVANDTKTNGTYSVYANGQARWVAPVEFGLGAKYNVYDVFDLKPFRDEMMGVFLPIVYKTQNQRVFADVSYESSKFDEKASYTGTGGSITYLHLISNYTLGVILSDQSVKSESTIFDYKAGRYQAMRYLVTRYDGRFSANLTIGFEDNDTNDQNWGTFVLPMSNKAVKYSTRLAYNLFDNQEISFRGLFADYTFKNNLAANGIGRADRFTSLMLRYNYMWTNVISTYLSASTNKNDSTYGDTQGINRNYTENLLSLGLTVSAF